ncbi:MAG: hypothetical protein U9O94_05880 [Nanoarchaeota archaeon]|nr:hypothetical protein [Nanoarchaeota archaeon]
MANPITWKTVNAPNNVGAMQALNQAGQNLGGAFQDLGSRIKSGAQDYTDAQTADFISELNAQPDEASRQQMINDASKAFLDISRIDKANRGLTMQDRADISYAQQQEQQAYDLGQRGIKEERATDRHEASMANAAAKNAEALRQQEAYDYNIQQRERKDAGKIEAQNFLKDFINSDASAMDKIKQLKAFRQQAMVDGKPIPENIKQEIARLDKELYTNLDVDDFSVNTINPLTGQPTANTDLSMYSAQLTEALDKGQKLRTADITKIDKLYAERLQEAGLSKSKALSKAKEILNNNLPRMQQARSNAASYSTVDTAATKATEEQAIKDITVTKKEASAHAKNKTKFIFEAARKIGRFSSDKISDADLTSNISSLVDTLDQIFPSGELTSSGQIKAIKSILTMSTVYDNWGWGNSLQINIGDKSILLSDFHGHPLNQAKLQEHLKNRGAMPDNYKLPPAAQKLLKKDKAATKAKKDASKNLGNLLDNAVSRVMETTNKLPVIPPITASKLLMGALKEKYNIK